MNKNIFVLPGDGIGPEIVLQAVKVIKAIDSAFDHKFELSNGLIGASSIRDNGEPITDKVIKKGKNADAVLLGAIGEPEYDNDPSIKVRPEQGLLKLRKSLSLYSNIRPVSMYDILKDISPLKNKNLKNVDLVVYRELTGGIYFGEKTLSEDGRSASDLCSYSVEEITRIAKMAFEAATNRRNKLTLVDKANVLETSRLWRKVVQEMAQKFPSVEVDYLYVDNAAMQMVINPAQFDVILTENMFGDIISDLSSVLTGSLGMLPSASIGKSAAMFEPCHGSYPQAAGKDIANPMATILSVAMMYDHFEMFKEAQAIRNAVNWALKENVVTEDITTENPTRCSVVGDLIAHYIEEKGEVSLNKRYMTEALNTVI
ncbi:MAG: 3-isopropylmalate dehydrogenase [Flavobacteriales bacterium]|nr:MAG: 3-isopropylmalate dehydrogenase [Flavobacteriales bacterium]